MNGVLKWAMCGAVLASVRSGSVDVPVRRSGTEQSVNTNVPGVFRQSDLIAMQSKFNLPTIYAEDTWLFTDTQLKQLSLDGTRLVASFLITNSDGTVTPWAGLQRLTTLQSQFVSPPSDWAVSVGGATDQQIGPVIKDPSKRATLVRSLSDYVSQHPYITGVDVDWEFPKTDSEKDALTAFVQSLRTELGPDRRITVAVTPAYYLNYYDFPALNPLVDGYCHMGYDFGSAAKANGPIHPRSDAPQTSLWILGASAPIEFSVAGALQKMIDLGADPAKIVAVMPGYCGESSDVAVSRKPYSSVVSALNLESRSVDPNTLEVIVGDTTCPSSESIALKKSWLVDSLNITQFGLYELGYETEAVPLTDSLKAGIHQPTLQPTSAPVGPPSLSPTPVSIEQPSLIQPSFLPTPVPVGQPSWIPSEAPAPYTVTDVTQPCLDSQAATCVATQVTYAQQRDATLVFETLQVGLDAGVNFTTADARYYSTAFAQAATPDDGGTQTQTVLSAIASWNQVVARITVTGNQLTEAGLNQLSELFSKTVKDGRIQRVDDGNTTEGSSDGGDDSKLSPGAIAGIVIGAYFGYFGLTNLINAMIRRSSGHNPVPTEVPVNDHDSLELGQVYPRAASDTVTMRNNEVRL